MADITDPAPAVAPLPLGRGKGPVSDSTLETMAILADSHLLVTDNLGSSPPRLLSFKTLEQKTNDSLPFAFNASVVNALATRGFIARINADSVETKLEKTSTSLGNPPAGTGPDKRKHLAWHDQPYRLSADGKTALEGMLPRLAAIRAEREAAANEPPRFLATRRLRGLDRQKPPDFAVEGLYRVVRETESRFYVRKIRDEDGVAVNVGNGTHDMALMGHGANTYVDKAHVAAVDIRPERFLAIRRAMSDYDEALTAAREQAEAEIAPIRLRHEDRRVQLEAQLADEMRELTGPEPAPQAGPKR